MSDQREKFEAWFVANNIIAGVPKEYWFECDGDGEYIDDDVFIANRAYQAGADSMQSRGFLI